MILRNFIWKLRKRKYVSNTDTAIKEIERQTVFLKNASHSQNNDAPVVLCLIKDGRVYIDSFMQHYLDLGFSNFVFLDNGSEDRTVDLISKHDVTILRCTLPFKVYKHEFKKFLVKKFAENRWSLMVDGDELWNYPYSEKVGLKVFFSYLDRYKYNAVQAHMLDMFADLPMNRLHELKDASIKEAYPYYDLSGLTKKKLKKKGNRTNSQAESYYGGIRATVFGVHKICLSKIPLIRWNKHISVHESAHFSRFVTLADVSTVLLHYKFVDGVFETIQKGVKDEIYFKNSRQYKKYQEKLQEDAALTLMTPSSKKYENTNQLIKDDFLYDSKAYREFVSS